MIHERWQVVFNHQGSIATLLLLIISLIILLSASIYELWQARASTPRWLLRMLLGLRIAILLLMFSVVVEPTLCIDTIASTKSRIVVLMDRSASMTVTDAASLDALAVSRQHRAKEFWQASKATLAEWQSQDFELQLWSFGEKLQPASASEKQTFEFVVDAASSNLLQAFFDLQSMESQSSAAAPSLTDPPLTGIVVISDGLVAHDAAHEQALWNAAKNLGIPISTVSVGQPALRDVGVSAVHASEFAFVENVMDISASIVAYGLQGQTAIVELHRNHQLMATKSIVLSSDGEATELKFSIAPDRIGQFAYEIAIRPFANEATLANNRWPFMIKVLRDKVRILHVSGRPDWDVRALRTLLRADPNVELLSYYILRDIEDSAREDYDAPLSLIQFPTHELFGEELGSFDIVILHNFDALEHEVGNYLLDIANYVEQGGALVIIGGDLGLATGDYRNSKLAQISPMDLNHNMDLDLTPFRPQLTQTGKQHPITSWIEQHGLASWTQLPQLDNSNPVQLANNTASLHPAVLLENPKNNRSPILTVAEPGKGRIMILATGSSWKLGFAANLPLIDGARPYDHLWLAAIRWLLRESNSARITVDMNHLVYKPNEPIEFYVRTASDTYQPQAHVPVTWRIDPVQEIQTSSPLQSGHLQTNEFSQISHTIQGLTEGSFAITAIRDDMQGENSRDQKVILIRHPQQEFTQIDADEGIARLRRLAEQTQGYFISAADEGKFPPQLPHKAFASLQITNRRKISLWDHWFMFSLTILTLGGEWILRRRYGLI